MVGPLRLEGLFSGINFTAITDQLVAVRKRPIANQQLKISKNTQVKAALLELSALLLSIKSTTDSLSRPSLFSTTKATSSNDTVLTATGDSITALGTFTFTAAKTARAHQIISNGFASQTAPISTSTGTVRIEMGNGYLDKRTPISFLNGQVGIDRGSIRITDSSNVSSVINLENIVTVQDVLDTINSATGIRVKASVQGDRIVVEDLAGGTPSNFKIENFGTDKTATNLGISGTGVSVASKTFIFGKDINFTTTATQLSLLNEGLGIRRNSDGISDFTITTASGGSVSVDIKSTDVSISNVISSINSAASAAGSTLRASLVDGSRIMLSGVSSPGSITVTRATDSLAAVDLGFGVLSGASFVTNSTENVPTIAKRVYGNRLIPALNSSMRNSLNGGMNDTVAGDIKGVRNGTITITDRQGDSVTLDTSSRVQTSTTSGSSIGQLSVRVSSLAGFAVGNKIRIVNASGTTMFKTVTDIDATNSRLYFDNGLEGAVSSGDIVVAQNDSLNDIMNLINNRAPANSVNVSITFNEAFNGLKIEDTSGGSGSLTVASSDAANDLGIVGSVSANSISGVDIDYGYINENTSLSRLNQGLGVQPGSIKVTDRSGKNFTVDLSQAEDNSIGRVISEINNAATAASSTLRARVNNTGDGLLLNDPGAGASTIRVEDIGGTRTARDLNIAGSAPSATPDTIDGSFEKVINIAANSTMLDVRSAINSAGLPVSAFIINDGSLVAPNRLVVVSKSTGEASRMVLSTTVSGLSFNTQSAPQDAVLVMGTNSASADPVVLTSSSNTIQNTIQGMTIEIKSASTTPVQVTVTKDGDAVLNQIKRFTDAYNQLVGKIKEFTAFDPNTFRTGVLFGDHTARQLSVELSGIITNVVTELPSGDLRTFNQIGVDLTDKGFLTFDESKFRSEFIQKPSQVEALFTTQKKLSLETPLSKFLNGVGVRSVIGNDFEIRLRNATTRLNIDIDGNETVAGVFNKILTASGNNGLLSAAISADGFSIELTDNSTIPTRDADSVGSPSTTRFSESTFAGVYSDGYFNDATITIVSAANSANNGLTRKVKSFTSSSGEFELDSALPAAITVGDTYTIERELEVKQLNSSGAAGDLGLLKKITLGTNVLKGFSISLLGDPGLGFHSSEVIDSFSRIGDGIISSKIKDIDDSISNANKEIKKIEEAAVSYQTRLVKEFASLEKIIAQTQINMQRLQASLSGFSSVRRT